MKTPFLLITALFFQALGALAQSIHTPAEIFDIMEKSPVKYSLNLLDTVFLPKDRSDNLVSNHKYRVSDGEGLKMYINDPDSLVQQTLDKAEDYYAKKNYSYARQRYLDALRMDSTLFYVMTYVGQTYELESDLDKAMEWYTKAIEANYIDYMAHWFLADAYKIKGDLDKAVDEITIASILNRNNPRIDKAMKDIYQLKKLKTDDWSFNPQMAIDSLEDKSISITFHKDWMGYALVKTVWRYEPGYKASMGVKEGTLSTIEEKEAFLSLLAPLDKKTIRKHPELKALNLALKKKMIDEYIIYEIMLPEQPYAASLFSVDFINDLKTYVINVRGKMK